MVGTTSAPQLPGYRDLSLLGRGGYSEVYAAYQDQFDRWVAVKVLTFALADDRAQRRFLRECRVAGRLSAHPNIVTVYDAGLSPEGRPYISMELFDRGSIADRIRSGGPFAVPDVLRIAVGLAGALETAHRAGVVHRDVKPGNVLLASYGQPALTDFGLSILAERQEVSAGVDALTPYHAPPEVLERTAVTPASDVYSLASTTYAMLAGRAPHQRTGDQDSMASLLLRILQTDVPPTGRTDVPPSLNAALQDALARDAHARTPSALAFAQAVQHVQAELGLEVTQSIVMDAPQGGEVMPAPPGRFPDLSPSADTGPSDSPRPAARAPGGPDVTAGHGSPPPGHATVDRSTLPADARGGRYGARSDATASRFDARGDATVDLSKVRGDVPGRRPRAARDTPGGRPRAAGDTTRHRQGTTDAATPHPLGASGDGTVGRNGMVAPPPPGVPLRPPGASWSHVPGEGSDHPGSLDGEETVHRSVVRQARRPADPTPASTSKLRQRALIATAVLVVAGLVAGGVIFALNRGGGDEEPEPATTIPPDVEVPTRVTATESEAGVQLQWQGDDAAEHVVLILSEQEPPQFLQPEAGVSHLVPATRLQPDVGYCFSVAILASLDELPPDQAAAAFSPPTCIRGASEDTVLTGEPSPSDDGAPGQPAPSPDPAPAVPTVAGAPSSDPALAAPTDTGTAGEIPARPPPAAP